MSNLDLITAADAAAILDRPRRTVIRLVERGDLKPAMKLPGIRGAYLFDPDHVRALAAERHGKEATP